MFNLANYQTAVDALVEIMNEDDNSVARQALQDIKEYDRLRDDHAEDYDEADDEDNSDTHTEPEEF